MIFYDQAFVGMILGSEPMRQLTLQGYIVFHLFEDGEIWVSKMKPDMSEHEFDWFRFLAKGERADHGIRIFVLNGEIR